MTNMSLKCFLVHRYFKLCFVILTVICLLTTLASLFSSFKFKKIELDAFYTNLFDLTVTQPFCSIPKLDPFDPEMMQHLQFYPRLRCEKIQSNLFRVQKGHLFFNNSDQSGNVMTSPENLICDYRCIEKHENDCQVKLLEWVDINLKAVSTPIPCESFQVRCRTSQSSTRNIYDNYFYQIIATSKVNSKMPKLPQSASEPTGSNQSYMDSPPNFVAFAIDSMSRSHFIRALPKTYNFLTEQLNALDFLSLNKVGDNTTPNLVAAVAGLRWGPEAEAQYNQTHFDDWPIVWKNFSAAGYATFFAEDFPKYTIFNSYDRVGFSRKVTDHYMRPMFLAAQGSFVRRWSSPLCMDTTPVHKVLSNAVLNLFEAYPPDHPKFALFMASEISHQDFSDVTQSDDDWLEFLQALKPNLHNTFLFVFGDHGYRYGITRQSQLGQMEGRLPAFFMIIPSWFRKKFPSLVETAVLNSRERLITNFDFHATAVFIAEQLWNNPVPSPLVWNRTNYGLPFFYPIPRNRTCEDAPIPADYCICQQSKPVPLNNSRVISASTHLVRHLNNAILSKYSQICAKLSLVNITMASVLLPDKGMIFSSSGEIDVDEVSVVYDLMITVNPSGAILQAKVKHSVHQDAFSVVGLVERLNLYGNQSHCVSKDRYAQLYCFCI